MPTKDTALDWQRLNEGWWRAARGPRVWVVQQDTGVWFASRIEFSGTQGTTLGTRDSLAKALAVCEQDATRIAAESRVAA